MNRQLSKTKEYYKKLYKRNVEDSVEDCDLQEYLPFSDIIKLSDIESNSLEGHITLKKAEDTVDRMKSNDSTGSDGFTLEFFLTLFGEILVNLLFDQSNMHMIITC